MCGFLGYIRDDKFDDMHKGFAEFTKKNKLIEHRGPDDEGYFQDEHVRFGFRRLSIIDVEAGHQPLSFEDQRYWIIFNGEIYNHVELREHLQSEGTCFETQSDTEVILALYQKYRKDVVHHLRGMFAFIIWDKEEKVLFGARDHFGIKPMYYAELEGETYFSSERKSLDQLFKEPALDEVALQHYLTFQYVPEPFSSFKEIKRFPPGHYFEKKLGKRLEVNTYWKPSFQPLQDSSKDWINEIRYVLRDSVEKHMRSDVPVGSFLSGGIDSSFIVSLAKEVNPEIKTFSVGFSREGFSEIDVAKETAEALGVENYHKYISADEYIAALPQIMWYLDEPLADPACVPLYFVAKEARKQVTVVLSGEGADELFGGYNIYREPVSLNIFTKIPKIGHSILRSLANVLPEGIKGKSFLERGVTPLQDRYIGNAKMFSEKEKQELLYTYQRSIHFKDITNPIYQEASGNSPVETMQLIDLYTWMRGDILQKADKMTMANSLELRVPFLDKEVMKVASTIPADLKIANGTTKHILRLAAEGIVPNHVLHRKKLGFPVPIRHWLKHELYDWANQLIIDSQTEHLINKQFVRRLLEEHCRGHADHSRKIWTVLVFMTWHQVYIEGSPTSKVALLGDSLETLQSK
ncbi:asparagine synthase (glutamine-hydrolyzing) [Mangrovibacillus cuniculi]|uniref:asparagine synthase (glutamine-hydrolyzing) n=1 Tax=Mangrovibacillus cuniculi TaxID=2593652 RepID=A0A7S8HH36_9BACI|nr:asparagine synthase (glutamine-hydrolyzing) [Mangrovibacillus cuniculi]QPC48427.1 asparagine synthase (glutamine-hydrolyzing) [Mangrovibacillus cuniculi]